MRSTDDEKKFRRAIKDSDVATMQAMIDAGFDVNMPLSHARLGPLHWAADDNAALGVFECLIGAGANVDGSGKVNNSPLHFAVRSGLESACLQLLLDAGADPNARTMTGETPLHFVGHTKRVGIISELVAAGADVNAVDFDDATPLHHAVEEDRADVCRALVASGAALVVVSEHEDDECPTPFQKAALDGKLEALRFFLDDCGERGDQTLSSGQSLLEMADPAAAEILRAWVTADEVQCAVCAPADNGCAGASRLNGPSFL
jgi:ankyrin repeat protein